MDEPTEVLAVEIIGKEPAIPAVQAPQVFSVSELETQVATANRYPRSVQGSMEELHVLANASREVAATMYYSLKRGGKMLEDASIRFAECLVHSWGNLRVYGRVVEVTQTEVVAEGYAWDIQKNAAIAKQVRRRILKANGDRYNSDMITMTGMAAISVAIRNATLSIVPRSLWQPALDAAMQTAVGEKKDMAAIRDGWVEWWEEQERELKDLWDYLGVRGKKDIGPHQMRRLLGLRTAIDEGVTTLDWELRKHGVDTSEETEAFGEALKAAAAEA